MNLNEKLTKSRFIQQIESEDEFIIWHSLFGYPKVVSRETLNLINLFENPKSIRSVLDKYEIDNGVQVFKELLSGYYLIPIGFDERRFLAKKIAERNEAAVNGSLIDYLDWPYASICEAILRTLFFSLLRWDNSSFFVSKIISIRIPFFTKLFLENFCFLFNKINISISEY